MTAVLIPACQASHLSRRLQFMDAGVLHVGDACGRCFTLCYSAYCTAAWRTVHVSQAAVS